MRIDKKDILIVISLFFIAFLIRAAGVSNVCMYGDEWGYWTKTNRILANNFVPPVEEGLGYGEANPFLSYIGAVVTVLFGGGLNTLRMTSVFFGSLTVPFLYLFGKAIYGRKTGILSALFLCFSAYHCLYSRIIMLEALTLFFITAFLYFFWRSQCSEQQKSTKYAIIAGATMGLAIDAKYISLFLVPAVLAYVLWTSKFCFKALLDKRLILMLVFAFLFFSPLLLSSYYTGLGLDPIYHHAIERFEKESVVNVRAVQTPPDELLMGGGGNILGILARGVDILNPFWAGLFLLSTISLFVIILLSFLPNFVNKEKESSFLMLSIFSLGLLLLACARHQHYMIYLLPFYFVMLPHIVVKSFEHPGIKREYSHKNIFKKSIISLCVIVLFTSVVITATSPCWDMGDYSWTKSAVEYIKSDAAKNGYEGHIVIGTITLREVIDYPFYLRDFGFNVSVISIFKVAGEYTGKRETIDLEKINMLKPHYLIVSENCYKYYFKGGIKREILKDYEITFYSKTSSFTKAYNSLLHSNPQHFVLKRRNVQPPELLLPQDGKDGKISHDIFKRSIPSVMKVGKPYTALVQVKNTGDCHTNFTVVVHSNDYVIFVERPCSEITLGKDSTRILKFKIVPHREYVGELPITVDLCVKYEESETWMKKVDSSSDCVYLIEK